MNKFFAAALAATALFASCAKEEQPVNGGEGKAATVSFSIQSDEPTRAALGNAAFDDPALGVGLWDLTVFVVNAGGSIIDSEYFLASTLDAAGKKDIETTTDAKYLIVVANTGADLRATKFNVSTVAALKAATVSLNEAVVLTTAGAAETSATQRIMLQGQSLDFTFVDNAGDMEATTSVAVSPIPARLNVKVVNNMATTVPGAVWADGYVKFESISILYSANNNFAVPTVGSDRTVADNYNYVIPAATATAPYYISGFDPTVATDEWDVLMDASSVAQNAFATSAPLTYLNRAWTTSDPATAATDFSGTFYALPGGGAHSAYPTIAVVGWYDQDGDAGTVYAPQRFFWHARMSGSDVAIMENGHQYDATITLSGDFTNGGGGVPDPDDEIVEGTVEVTITAAGWPTAIVIDKEIN